jgi:hypothetical protein
VTKLLDKGWLKEEYRSRLKKVFVHSIHADAALADLTLASKFNCDWNFLTELRDRGRRTAEQWLDENFEHIGKWATVDLRKDYLGESALGKGTCRGSLRAQEALPDWRTDVALGGKRRNRAASTGSDAFAVKAS